MSSDDNARVPASAPSSGCPCDRGFARCSIPTILPALALIVRARIRAGESAVKRLQHAPELAAVALGLLLLAAGGAPAQVAAPSPSARQILDRVDDLYRGDSSHGRANMTVTTEHWKRTLELEFWTRGKDESLVRILAPKKEQGTATLKSGNDLWNYLPKVKRVIKLPSSMLAASWMGSHFTNDDLVKEHRMAEDYDCAIGFAGPRDGRDVVEVDCKPKPEAAVVWGKVVVVVNRDDELPRRVEYYDEDMHATRTLAYSDVRPLGGRAIPTRMEMTPLDKPGESTVVTWEEIQFDAAVDPETFTLRALQR
jgi:outer membrane lipoprotein-sorting protein